MGSHWDPSFQIQLHDDVINIIAHVKHVKKITRFFHGFLNSEKLDCCQEFSLSFHRNSRTKTVSLTNLNTSEFRMSHSEPLSVYNM
jgi:hypothetical protein